MDTGTAKREFLYSEDMTDACVHLMNLPDDQFNALLDSDEAKTGQFNPPLVNIGVGTDVTIRELAETVKVVVGHTGEIVFDTNKPNGTPGKLMVLSRLAAMGWTARTWLYAGLTMTYSDFLKAQAHA